jgi:hypothetical protein
MFEYSNPADLVNILHMLGRIAVQIQKLRVALSRLEGIARGATEDDNPELIYHRYRTMDGYGPRLHYEFNQLDRLLREYASAMETELIKDGKAKEILPNTTDSGQSTADDSPGDDSK